MRRTGVALCVVAALAGSAGAQSPVDPPPVDEAALARRLADMTKPAAGERALILYDPTYYPGITTRLREELHRRGVSTFAFVEETQAMIDQYFDREPDHARREQEVVGALRPLFQAADIFYWMPTRAYADDLRWERLVEQSRVRSVHFHWMLRFPGTRKAEDIATQSRDIERRALTLDFDAHAGRQQQLARALRGQDVRITTPGGTDLTLHVPRDQWFHFGDGDASAARAAVARSIRDRQQEMPVGMFNFVPEAATVRGRLVANPIERAGEGVRDAVLTFEQGRVTTATSGQDVERLRARFREIGPDGDKIGTIFLNTHPDYPHAMMLIDIGSNWENGGHNRADGARRILVRLPDATVTAGGRTIVQAGRIRWDALP